MHRHLGVQRPVKRIWLPCRLEQMTAGGRLEESMLFHMLPAGWLPSAPGDTLVSIAHAGGSTGLKRLNLFRPWARHFDCYILELWHDEQ